MTQKRRSPYRCSCQRVLKDDQCWWCDKPVANYTLDRLGFWKV